MLVCEASSLLAVTANQKRIGGLRMIKPSKALLELLLEIFLAKISLNVYGCGEAYVCVRKTGGLLDSVPQNDDCQGTTVTIVIAELISVWCFEAHTRQRAHATSQLGNYTWTWMGTGRYASQRNAAQRMPGCKCGIERVKGGRSTSVKELVLSPTPQ